MNNHLQYCTKQIKFYVINLKDSTGRWKTMQSQLQGLDVERIDAVNGKTLDYTNIHLHVLVKANLRKNTKHSQLEIGSLSLLGASLSHIECWKRIVASNTPSVVLEDDVKLLSDFSKRVTSAAQSSYHLVFLGVQHGHATKGVEAAASWSKGGPYRTGAHAYYLTPTAAKELLEHAFPLLLAIDHYMWGQYSGEIGYTSATSTSLAFSTITHVPIDASTCPTPMSSYVCLGVLLLFFGYIVIHYFTYNK